MLQSLTGLAEFGKGHIRIETSDLPLFGGGRDNPSPPNVTANHTLFMAPINHHQLNQSLQLPGLSTLSRMGSSGAPVTLDVRAPSPFISSAFTDTAMSPFAGPAAPLLSKFRNSFDLSDCMQSRSVSPFYTVTSTESEFGSEFMSTMHSYICSSRSSDSNAASLKRKRGMDSCLNEYVKTISSKRFNITALSALSQEECIGKILRTSTDDTEDDMAMLQAAVSAQIEERGAKRFRAESPMSPGEDTLTDVCSSDDEELNAAALFHKEQTSSKTGSKTDIDDWGLIVPTVRLSPFLEAVSVQLLKNVSDDLLPSEYAQKKNSLEEKYKKLKLKHEKLSYVYLKELQRGKQMGLELKSL